MKDRSTQQALQLCCGMRPFSSFAPADAAAKARNRRSGCRFHAFRCAGCCAWHIGANYAPKSSRSTATLRHKLQRDERRLSALRPQL